MYQSGGITLTTQFTTSVESANIISSQSAEITAGEAFSLPIAIESNSGIMGFEIKVTYDPLAISPTSVTGVR